MNNFLVTGALGCIGAWVVRNLIQQGENVTVYDLGSDIQRLQLIMREDELARVNFIFGGDITNLAMLEKAIGDNQISHVIHLAALQIPFCRADPIKGAMVNVVGHVNMFEAVKNAGLKRLVYASSVAVYGIKEEYEKDLLPHDAHLNPRTHYGVYKQANEGTARIYWQDNQISSIGLRPSTIYGLGRDQGLTSSPTKAMLAAAAGQPFHIPYGGYNGFQLADDVAKMFILAAQVPFEGADVFNIKGEIAHMQQIVDAIHAVEPAVQITFDDKPLPFPDSLEDAALRAVLGDVPATPLAAGIAQTIHDFKRGLGEGKVQFTP